MRYVKTHTEILTKLLTLRRWILKFLLMFAKFGWTDTYFQCEIVQKDYWRAYHGNENQCMTFGLCCDVWFRTDLSIVRVCLDSFSSSNVLSMVPYDGSDSIEYLEDVHPETFGQRPNVASNPISVQDILESRSDESKFKGRFAASNDFTCGSVGTYIYRSPPHRSVILRIRISRLILVTNAKSMLLPRTIVEPTTLNRTL